MRGDAFEWQRDWRRALIYSLSRSWRGNASSEATDVEGGKSDLHPIVF